MSKKAVFVFVFNIYALYLGALDTKFLDSRVIRVESNNPNILATKIQAFPTIYLTQNDQDSPTTLPPPPI